MSIVEHQETESRSRWAWLRDELQQARESCRYRQLRSLTPLPGGRVAADGRELLNLCSNNYLGISEELAGPGWSASDLRLAGATASRLVVGNHPSFGELETAVARLKEAEASLVFSCGYMANLGILSALAGRGDAVYADRHVHASIIDGIALSGARHIRYRHNDVDHLRGLLAKGDEFRRRMIVTEGIFSMDGDAAPLVDLVRLKREFDAVLIVDEAHSNGVYGQDGAGLAQEQGLAREIDVQMGTFGKAYGAYGAYVAGDQLLIDYLINTARSFLFTTALPPLVNRLNLRALDIVRDQPWRRRQLFDNAAFFRAAMRQRGHNIGASTSYIVPWIIGGERETLAVSKALWDRGIAAVAIRPPTVPAGGSRIRLSLMATHQRADLEYALQAIDAAAGQMHRQV